MFFSVPDCDINHCDPAYCSGSSCIKCEDGYYLSGTHCYDCPTFCVTCTGPATCTECVRGRYGFECDYTCSALCTDCISSSQCTECIPGRHGPYCQFYCPLGCIDILCEKESGKCTKGCRHGYYKRHDDCLQCPEHCAKCIDSVSCTECFPGYYGLMCENMCHPSCIHQLCDINFGNCTEGCSDGYYKSGNSCETCPDWCAKCITSSTCTECTTGRWGIQCQHHCPAECSLCSTEGTCIDGKL